MMRAIRPVLTLTWKDILLEIRSKDILISVVVFGVVVVVMFNFALNVDALSADRLAPGILWVAFAFSGVLAMNRSYALEKDRGSLEGLLLCPVSGDELYFGKMLGIFLFMIIIQVILLAVFAILFNFSGFSASLGLAIVLATLGFASVGTLFAAIAVQIGSNSFHAPGSPPGMRDGPKRAPSSPPLTPDPRKRYPRSRKSFSRRIVSVHFALPPSITISS